MLMKKSKFNGERMAFALREAKVGTPVAEVCRTVGISGGAPSALKAGVRRSWTVRGAQDEAT